MSPTRSVIVTGAGKGIGRDTAVLLSARGWHVVALSRTRDDLDALAAQTGCTTVAVDLADPGTARAAFAQALRDAPAAVTGLVNCAGIVRMASFVETSVDDFQQTIAVNTIAPMVASQEFARALVAAGRSGAIVNVSSIAARVGTARHAAYCASKGALDAMTRVMALELGPQGIRVNSVNPVVTLTPMGAQAWSDPQRAAPMLARIPLGRFARPAEIASVIAFLLDADSAMINGACIDVDGGFRAA